MSGGMADGSELRSDDPRLAHLKAAHIEGPLDPTNVAANIVPVDMAGVDAIAGLIMQGINNDAMNLLIRSTLALNFLRRQLGRKSLALEPIKAEAVA